MSALKIVVVAMGVLIVVGFTVMVTEVVRRSTNGGEVSDEIETYDVAGLDLESGERVVALTALRDRLVLVVEGADGTQRILGVALDLLR